MHPRHHSHVLQLDIQGTPQAWISLEHAALHVASDAVAWVDGAGLLATLRGGYNVALGRQSLLEIHPIAKRRFTLDDHVAATAGVECRKDAGVIDETPAAYKDIDAVMAAQSGLVDVVHTLKQVVCVKG